MHMNEQEAAKKIIEISGVNPRLCMKCGKCSGTCPAFHEMDIHPHEFVDLVNKGRIEKLLESKSIWTCLSCFACVERCPRTVEPAALIEAVRLTVIRQKGANHMKTVNLPELIAAADDKENSKEVYEEIPQQALVSAYRKYNK